MRAVAAAVLAVGIPCAAALEGPAADRKPPSPGPPRPLTLPPVERHALSNGLAVHLVESHEVPTVELVLAVGSGAAADPGGRPGVAAMTANLLDEGAGGRDALALADALDFLGADLGSSSSWDYSLVRLHVPVARLEQALPLMADVALRPDFPERELVRLRKEALTTLLQARDEPREVAQVALLQAVFGPDHRYHRPAGGDAASLKDMGVAHVREFHRGHYGPGNAALVVVGDVDASVLPLLEKAFGAWSGERPAAASVPPPPQVAGRQLWLIDKPGAPQSVIRIGRVGPPRATPRYHALEVMNTLLGGSFTSRLNDNLREQHGYAYGAGSTFGYRKVAGLFLAAADVQTPSTAAALTEFLKELERIRTPPAPEEVARARGYLAYGHAGDFETTRQIAARVADRVIYGLPADALEAFVPKVLAVGPADVASAARDHVDTRSLAIVVVGDRKAVEPGLKSLGIAPLKTLGVDDVMGPPPAIE